jgi:hypothetical protein
MQKEIHSVLDLNHETANDISSDQAGLRRLQVLLGAGVRGRLGLVAGLLCRELLRCHLQSRLDRFLPS